LAAKDGWLVLWRILTQFFLNHILNVKEIFVKETIHTIFLAA
jgi:hypothetical protein